MPNEQLPLTRENKQVFKELHHPGFLNKDVTFDEFLPFMSFEGIRPEYAEEIRLLLQSIFPLTKHLWKPGLCVNADKIAKALDVKIPNVLSFPCKTLLMINGITHSWTELILPENKSFIVDPTGVSDHGISVPILPYFGLVENCKIDGVERNHAQQIYRAGFLRFF